MLYLKYFSNIELEVFNDFLKIFWVFGKEFEENWRFLKKNKRILKMFLFISNNV